MKVSAAYPDLQPEDIKSDLPPGGSPGRDRAYSDWAREFIDEIHPRVLDRLTGDRGEILATATQFERAFNAFRITQHLYKWIIGWKFPDGTGPNYHHRLRFVATQFHLRRAELVAEAEAYVERAIRELRRA